jgi:hypothetical protein
MARMVTDFEGNALKGAEQKADLVQQVSFLCKSVKSVAKSSKD